MIAIMIIIMNISKVQKCITQKITSNAIMNKTLVNIYQYLLNKNSFKMCYVTISESILIHL